MDLFEAIGKRHSYRGGFKKTSIPEADLRAIVDAGMRAPSGMNAQSTSFVVVHDPEGLRDLAAIVDRPVVNQAQAIIICVIDPTPTFDGQSFCVEDCSAAVENMLLAVTALGYASVWIDGTLRRERRAERIRERFGIPADRKVRVILPLGVPVDVWPQKEKRGFNERAWFGRWGGVSENA